MTFGKEVEKFAFQPGQLRSKIAC